MISVIGLGEIGRNVFYEIARISGKESVFGVDINDKVLEELTKEGFSVGKTAPPSDVYIVCVYLTEQVSDVLKTLDYSKKPLVSIDATILPGTAKKITDWREKAKVKFDLVLFPHRFNPRDPEHYVFNLDRVMGAENEQSLKRALKFFGQYINPKLIHTYSMEIVELSKPVENAYRFMEIAIAQQLKLCCNEKGIDFEKLREAASTKWNINIYEARDGIGGKCLPKDIALINSYFPNNDLFAQGIKFNEKYKKWFDENKDNSKSKQ